MSGRVRWSPSLMAALEDAVERRGRVVLTRRGTEYVVQATRLKTFGREDVLVGRLPLTGDTMEFVLGELDTFVVLDD
jgi:hypothetical protein